MKIILMSIVNFSKIGD